MAGHPEEATDESTAAYILGLAVRLPISSVKTESGAVSPRKTRLADDAIEPDEIECTLFALHRAYHLDLRELILLQMEYQREAKP